jgi:cell division protein FtsN
MRRFAFLLAAVMMAAMLTAAGSATGHAQDTALDRVQNLINTGRFTEARNTLEQWERGAGDPRSSATTADRARALFLRGVLSTDPKDAEDAFVGVVLSYPSSAVAPAALLRLGQGLLAGGDARRAVAYLERLRSDYPGARERETGWLWLARAQHASGAATAACATAREGLAAASTANMRTLLELERDNVCAAADGQPRGATPTVPAPARDAAGAPPAQRTTPPAATPPAQGTPPPTATPPAQGTPPPAATPPAQGTPPPAATLPPAPPTAAPPTAQRTTPTAAPPTAAPPTSAPPTAAPPTAAPPTAAPPTAAPPTATPPTAAPRAAASPAGLLFAVQTAAFRERSNAVSAAAQLRARGFVSRVVAVEGSPLFHVRFGSFATRAEADAAAQRIRDAGLSPIVVSDVRLER